MANRTHHILAISGSLRRGSFNTALIRAAADLAPDSMKIDPYPIGDLPLFNADLEATPLPEPVIAFRAEVAESDALLLATPEYNYSTTAALKNAADWASRGGAESPLNFKPAAMLGAGGRFGTLRAQLHLREILSHNHVRLVTDPQVFVTNAPTRFDEEGHLTDQRARDQIGRLLAALEALINKA